MLLSFTACGAKKEDADREAVISQIESFFNDSPRSSYELLRLCPFDAGFGEVDNFVKYTCVKIAEANSNGKEMKNTVSERELSRKFKEYFGLNLESANTAFTKVQKGGTVTFTCDVPEYTPVFSLEDIDVSGSECTADFRVSKIPLKNGASGTVKARISFRFTVRDGELATVTFISGRIEE